MRRERRAWYSVFTMKTRISIFLLAAASMSAAHAADIQKADNTDNLNLESSWVGGTVPGAGDVAVWPLVPSQTLTTSLGAPLEFAGIIVTNAAGSTLWNNYSITINGSDTLSLGSGGILYGGKKTMAVYAPLSVTADHAWTCNGGGTLGIYGTVAFNGNTVTGRGSNTKETKGRFSGPGTLVNEGGAIKMSAGSAAPDVDFVARLNAGAVFDQTPATGGAYRFSSVTLNGLGHNDGAYIQSIGRKNEDGHDLIGPLTATNANGVVTTSPNAAKHLTLEADSLAIGPTAFLYFRGANLGVTPQADLVPGDSSVLFKTAPALVGGGGAVGTVTQSILPAAIVSTNTSVYGMSLATYDSAYGIRMLDPTTEYSQAVPFGQNTLENVRLANDGTAGAQLSLSLPDGTTTVNSLFIDIAGENGTGGYLIDAEADASPVLRINSGMVYVRNFKSQSRTANVDNIPVKDVALDFAGHRGTVVSYQSDSNNMTAQALELRGPIVNDGGEGVNFCSVQGRGFVYLYGTSASTYTGPTRLISGLLKLSKPNSSTVNVCIPGDLEIYSGTCQNTGNTLPDTSDIRIYGGTLSQKAGASNSGSGAQETFRNLTMYGGSYGMGADGTSSGSTTMESALLEGGTLTQTRGHSLTVHGVFALAGGTNAVHRFNSSSNRTRQFFQGGVVITNTAFGAYVPMIYDAGTNETTPGAKAELSVGLSFAGNAENDNTAVIHAAAPGEGIDWAQFLLNGALVFDIGDGAAAVDLRIEPQLVDNGTTAGSIRKTGAGTLALVNPASSYTGGTTVEAGALVADGALAGDVTVASGAAFQAGTLADTGALAVDGDLALAAGAHLRMEASASAATLGTFTGDVTASGQVVVDSAYTEDADTKEARKILAAHSIQGTFVASDPLLSVSIRKGGTELWICERRATLLLLR